jgi:hypothetical protein
LAHFIDTFADRAIEILHDTIGHILFFKQEIVEVPGLLTGLLITYDGVKDDMREEHTSITWEEFLDRMSLVKSDWKSFDRRLMEELARKPHKGLGGWENRTIYFIKSGHNPEQWTAAQAQSAVTDLLVGSWTLAGTLIRKEMEHLREAVPVGQASFQLYERQVRIVFNFLFHTELGPGQAQSRTEIENEEGVEIRDLVFVNKATSGFWQDLKNKYSASEIVVDAKNTDDLKRGDLRELYCYLKPALGFWGFIVCRAEPDDLIQAFNRTLFKNFAQRRGVLILCDDDLRRMIDIANRGAKASEYLQNKMSEFLRSV